MAEGRGFEPPDPVKGQRFSRPPQSTTLPPFRDDFSIASGVERTELASFPGRHRRPREWSSAHFPLTGC